MNPQFWDERFKNMPKLYGDAPNVFFRQELDKLPKGKILLPGDGEGRNGIYAAQTGWEVTAFDSSKVAIQNALDHAKNAGVDIDYQYADTTTFTAPEESYDVIALVFFHLTPEYRVTFHQDLYKWLKTGGTLIIEAFNPQQLNHSSGGPKDPEMLYSVDMLQEDFSKFTQLDIHTKVEYLKEGFHDGAAELIRLIGKK